MAAKAAAARIPGGGAMGERVRALDWSGTPLGPIEGWPPCLCTAISIVLASPFPSVLFWGPKLTFAAYNDAYRPLLGSKPEALGRSVLEVWAEVSEALAPQFGRTLAGETIAFSKARFTPLRGIGPGEAWFDYGFSPVYDDTGQVAGVFHTCVETTAQVRAEAAQNESEMRWRAVFDHMGEGFEITELIFGPEGRAVDFRYMDVNAAWERHSGFPRDMVVGRRATEVFPPEETPFWIDLLGRVAETGEAAHLERYFPPAARWLEVIVHRLGPEQVALLIRNITERHEAAERQQAALETGLIGFFEWDLARDTVTGDERFARFYGLDPAATAAGVPRGSLIDQMHPDDRATVQAQVEEALASCEEIASEFRVVRSDGGVRWLLVRSRCTGREGKRPSRYTGTAVDETERVRAENALRESEARLQLALDASGMVGLYDWHIPDDRLFADARFARLFGVDPDRVALGAPLAEFARQIHPDDWPLVEAAVRRAMATGEPYESEYRLAQDDGEERWVAARGRCLLGPEGVPLRFSGTVMDITKRRHAEERQALLSREVDHRAKNALAVVQAALRLTRAPDLPSYVQLIEGRVAALARAQTLLSEDHWAGADLRTLLRGELDGFLGPEGGTRQQVLLNGPKVALPAGAAQPFAMAIHELATNAIKYGALSVLGGRAAVSWALEGGPTAARLRLRWAEEGGPPVEGAPAQRGFGTRVLDGTVRGQLGGAVTLSWKASGLVCDIEVPLERHPSKATSAGDNEIAAD